MEEYGRNLLRDFLTHDIVGKGKSLGFLRFYFLAQCICLPEVQTQYSGINFNQFPFDKVIIPF